MKQSETQSRRTCKLLPLTRRQKILRNLILILLAVCVLALRPQSEYVHTSDAALDRALNKQLGMLQPYEIIADYELPEDMDFFHREVYVRTSVQDKPQIAIVRIQKHEDGRYSPYFDPQIVSEEEMNSDTPLGFLGLWGKQPEAEQGIYHMTCPENFPQLGTDADVKFEPDCGDGRVRVAIDRWRVGDKPDDPKQVAAPYGIKLKQGETYDAAKIQDLIANADVKALNNLSDDEKADLEQILKDVQVSGKELKIAADDTSVAAADGTADPNRKTGERLTLQIGDTADSFNKMKVNVGDMHAKALGIADLTIADQDGAAKAIQSIKDAINTVSSTRGDLGAIQNRLEHTSNNLSVMTENIQDAESTIRDTDVADEMMAYTKNNILIQSAQAMLAQANQVPQGVLQLLQ